MAAATEASGRGAGTLRRSEPTSGAEASGRGAGNQRRSEPTSGAEASGRAVLKARWAAVLMVVVVVAAAVPSSAGAGGGDAPPFRVAGIVDVELFRGAEVGARARFDAVNAGGGLEGRTIEFLGVTDDRRDAATARAEVRRLVQDVRVDAVVPVVTSRFTDDGALGEARVPAFGWGIAGGFCGSRWTFAITGCRAPLLPREVPGIWGELVASVLAARGVRRPTAAIVTEAAAVPRSLDELRAVARGAGMRVRYARAALGTGEGATAGIDEVADAIMRGARPPSAVFAVAGFSAVGALQEALRARGYEGVMTNLVQYAPALVVPANGAFVLTEFATPESSPGNASMSAILAEIARVTTDEVTPSMIAGWLAADLWVRSVKAAGAGASPGAVARAASTIRYRVPGTVGPTRYPVASVRPTSCGQLVTSDGTRFAVAARYRCSRYVGV